MKTAGRVRDEGTNECFFFRVGGIFFEEKQQRTSRDLTCTTLNFSDPGQRFAGSCARSSFASLNPAAVIAGCSFPMVRAVVSSSAAANGEKGPPEGAFRHLERKLCCGPVQSMTRARERDVIVAARAQHHERPHASRRVARRTGVPRLPDRGHDDRGGDVAVSRRSARRAREREHRVRRRVHRVAVVDSSRLDSIDRSIAPPTLPLRVAPDARAHTKRRLTRRSRSLVRRLPRVRARLRRRLQAGASRVRSSPPSRLARNPPREARV